MTNLRYFDGIRYGDFSGLDVMVDPSNNSLFVTQPTIGKVLSYQSEHTHEKLSSKKLKAFAGKDLIPTKKAVTAIDSVGRSHTMKAIPFEAFLTLVHFEAFHGKDPHRTAAQGLLLAGFADSFSSMVLEQCGIRLSHEERQQVISFYRQWYHKFQDWVRDTHLSLYGVKPGPDYYREMAIVINQYLFQKKHFNCDRLGNAETQQLRVLENFQMQFLTTKTAKSGKDPISAMRSYISVLESL